MRGTFLFLLSFGAVIAAPAQFYPDSNATWCMRNNEIAPPGFDVVFQMGRDPDTLILGRTYKKIDEYNNADGPWLFVQRYHVRSDPNGKGYMFLPDSMEEYLIGDVYAQAGDTVRGVLWFPAGMQYQLNDFVIDSVTTLTRLGVTVTRQYLPFTYPHVHFWQAGMGSSAGPMLGPQILPICITVDDTVRFTLFDEGLPGGPQCCAPLRLGLDDRTDLTQTVLELSPNPAANRLTIRLDGMDARLAAQVRLFDATGKQAMAAAMRGPLLQLDVSRLSGLFMVVVDRGNERFTGRVIIN